MNGTSHIPALEAARPRTEDHHRGRRWSESGKNPKRQNFPSAVTGQKQHGWRINSPRNADQRGGTVSIDMPDAEQVCRELLQRDILVDYRPRAGRPPWPPHFYNKDEETDDGDYRK